MKFGSVKPGDVLYDVHSYKMGNTPLRTVGIWEVHVIEVNDDSAVVSWNGNRNEIWHRSRVAKLRRVRPELVSGVFGSKRLKRKGKG